MIIEDPYQFDTSPFDIDRFEAEKGDGIVFWSLVHLTAGLSSGDVTAWSEPAVEKDCLRILEKAGCGPDLSRHTFQTAVRARLCVIGLGRFSSTDESFRVRMPDFDNLLKLIFALGDVVILGECRALEIQPRQLQDLIRATMLLRLALRSMTPGSHTINMVLGDTSEAHWLNTNGWKLSSSV